MPPHKEATSSPNVIFVRRTIDSNMKQCLHASSQGGDFITNVIPGIWVWGQTLAIDSLNIDCPFIIE